MKCYNETIEERAEAGAIMGMEFEWDDEKERVNIRKHGISFETAQYVFMDEWRIEWYDKEHSIEEERYKALGKVGAVILVVFTERGDRTRIISARPATKEERRRYYHGIG